jgi:hypothetical protein
MKRKNIESYILFFSVLKELFAVDGPKFLILDFEQSSFVAFKKNYPSTEIYGCLFHFTQIVWRKIQNLNMATLYNESYEFKLHTRMFMALAFAPSEQILSLAELLNEYYKRSNAKQEIFDLFMWFKKNFLYNALPNHQPEFWSVFERIKHNIPRTTNSLEGYHRHLNNVCDVTHATLLSLGKELIKEQLLSSKYILDSFKGYFSKSVEKNSKEEIEYVVENFENFYDVEFLKAIVVNFKFPIDN